MVNLPKYLTHGTYNCYAGKLSCRCEPCCQAMKNYMDKWRREHGQAIGPFAISCVTCSAQFDAANQTAKYCSAGCKPKQDQSTKRMCRSCTGPCPLADEPSRIPVGLCASCQVTEADSMTSCPLCGVTWWSGDGSRHCSEECETLDAARQAIVQEDYL
jgi:hypothetical protein